VGRGEDEAAEPAEFGFLRAHERVAFFFARVDVDVRDLETFRCFDKKMPEK
jgi:hypothetical protein